MTLRIFLVAPSDLLTDHRPHGDGLVAHGFVRGLAERGHEVHVAAGRVDLREPLPATARVHALGAAGTPPPIARLRFMSAVRALYRRLALGAPFDVIHQLNPVEVGLSLALADARAPVVLGPYIPDWAASGAGADREVGRAALAVKGLLRGAEQHLASALLLSTPAAEATVRARRAPRPLVRRLSAGIDDREWRPAERDAAGQDVLFLANLEVRKGVHVLLDAFARIALELPDARLRIAGAGPELEAVRARAAASPGAEHIRLLGPVGRERVQAVMQDCDVFCLPSYGEPFGMVALEAMACAKPVVATREGGLGQLVPDGGGPKVVAGDAAALAAALREVLADPALARRMGARNRREVEERYAWSRVIERLEAIYAEAMAAGRPAALRRRTS
jgi:L-malate glycosyltransferase